MIKLIFAAAVLFACGCNEPILTGPEDNGIPSVPVGIPDKADEVNAQKTDSLSVPYQYPADK